MKKRPEHMSRSELKAFVRKALRESKNKGSPDDVLKWYKATLRITSKDLNRRLR